ncbi:hypothetical protein [Fibrella aquatica]|uniref:hypothetical protein n=1 Tax=Fibrella aquatica TaxID=3242487 RepID=UPI003520F99A
MLTLIDVYKQLNKMGTAEECIATREAIQQLEQQPNVSPEDIAEIWQKYDNKRDVLIDQAGDLVAEFRDVLRLNGVDYPLTEWLTPTRYIKKFNIPSVATITNWVARGIIPADHVKDIEQLGIRLIKAVPYEPRTYNKGA